MLNQSQAQGQSELVITNQQGQSVTTSLIVAQVFNKEHKNVLRDIHSLECSEDFNRLNFELIKYTDIRGREQDAYEMTKDGFSFLVMGYTGAKAAQFKETFIQEFNKREMLLQSEDYILMRSQEILIRRLEAQVKEIQALKEKNEKLAYKAENNANKASCYDKVLYSTDCRTTTQIANEIGLTAKELHLKLKELGVIYQQSGQWLLHRPYSTYALHRTRTATFTREDGRTGTRTQTVWTEKGRVFIRSIHKREFDKQECAKYFKWVASQHNIQ